VNDPGKETVQTGEVDVGQFEKQGVRVRGVAGRSEAYGPSGQSAGPHTDHIHEYCDRSVRPDISSHLHHTLPSFRPLHSGIEPTRSRFDSRIYRTPVVIPVGPEADLTGDTCIVGRKADGRRSRPRPHWWPVSLFTLAHS
jgi:hypothetical protein